MSRTIEQIAADHLSVWNSAPGPERDAAAASVYSPEVAVLESEAVYAGLAGLSEAIDGLQQMLPDMQLALVGPIRTAQELSTYAWSLGPAGAPPVVTGRDVLRITDGLITHVYVLVDPPGQ